MQSCSQDGPKEVLSFCAAAQAGWIASNHFMTSALLGENTGKAAGCSSLSYFKQVMEVEEDTCCEEKRSRAEKVKS